MRVSIIVAAAIALSGCAGRSPQPVAIVQLQDVQSTCAMLTAEIEANNIKVKELASEQGIKLAQNVAAGVAGFVIPVLWFGMDWQGSAGKDLAALQARQQYLASLAAERCKTEHEANTKKARR
jgi:hypothetical protein